MSTDYGFYCQQCDEAIIPDNLGSYAIWDALKAFHAMADLSRAARSVRQVGTLDVDVSAYWCYMSFSDLLEFAEKHEHHLCFVADEYGNTYDAATQKRHEPSLWKRDC